MNELGQLLLLNLRNLMMSMMGFAILCIVLERTAGFRYGRPGSVILIFFAWAIRFFGLQLYIQIWLGNQYGTEGWYQQLLSVASVFNVLCGVMFIAFAFKGSLLKNLFMTIFVEVICSASIILPFAFAYQTPSDNLHMNGSWNRKDFLIILIVFLAWMAVIHFVDPWLKRYRSWEPKHPVILLVIVGVYLINGLYNNIHYALSHGDSGVYTFISLSLLIIIWIWTAFFFREKEKARALNRSLVRHETALKNHYETVLTQSAKLSQYNQEIRKAMEALMTKLSSGNTDQGSAFTPYDGKMQETALTYLESLEHHYQEITASRYSEDAGMNELLEAYKEKFRRLRLSLHYHFHRYIRPEEVSEEDMESLLSFMLDAAIRGQGSTDRDDTVLQAGMSKDMLIISCEYSGKTPPGKEVRTFKRLLSRLKADSDIGTNQGRTKIIVGLKQL